MKATLVWKKSAISEEGKPAPVISALQIGNPGKLNSSHIIVGTELGSILFFPLFHKQVSDTDGALECQGSSITSIHLCKTSVGLKEDIIVGDAAGNVQTFINGSSANSMKIDQPVSALLFDRDLYANPLLFVGDYRGHLSGFVPMINNEKCFKVSVEPNYGVFGRTEQDWSVLAIISIDARPPQTNTLSHYTVVATRCKTLHFYSGSSKVFNLNFPSPIRAICAGYFSTADTNTGEQLAVALEDGDIHLVTNFVSSKWVSTDHLFTSIATLRDPSTDSQLDSASTRKKDLLLGIGHFNGIIGYQDGEKLLEHETHDWAHLLAVSELKAPASSKISSRDYVAIVLMDNSIEVLDIC